MVLPAEISIHTLIHSHVLGSGMFANEVVVWAVGGNTIANLLCILGATRKSDFHHWMLLSAGTPTGTENIFTKIVVISCKLLTKWHSNIEAQTSPSGPWEVSHLSYGKDPLAYCVRLLVNRERKPFSSHIQCLKSKRAIALLESGSWTLSTYPLHCYSNTAQSNEALPFAFVAYRWNLTEDGFLR